MAAAVKFSLDTPVKLVNTAKKLDVVTFTNGLQGRAQFSPDYKHLELVMQLIGIDVPLEQAKNYPTIQGDKRRITLSDSDFGIAFFNLYYKRSMNPEEFHWETLNRN